MAVAKRVQILVMEPGQSRWRFLAHGAAYDRGDAESMAESRRLKGDKVRFLPVPKGS